MLEANMIDEIVRFVGQHHESIASIAVCRRILGSYPGEINRATLSRLQDELQAADPEEVESLYYIIR